MRWLAALVLCACAITWSGCGYALAGRGSFLPTSIRTVGIPRLENRSNFFQVEDILTEKNVQGAPALVVEIASPGTRRRDEQIKRQLFDRGGVREYWIVDPDAHIVRVFRRQPDGSLAAIAELARETVLTTPLLPGLEIRLKELFAP